MSNSSCAPGSFQSHLNSDSKFKEERHEESDTVRDEYRDE